MASTVQQLPGAAFLSFPGMDSLLADEFSGRFNTDCSGARRHGELLYLPD